MQVRILPKPNFCQLSLCFFSKTLSLNLGADCSALKASSDTIGTAHLITELHSYDEVVKRTGR